MAPTILSNTSTTPLIVAASSTKPLDSSQYKLQIVWRNVFIFLYLHLFAIYGLYQIIFSCQWKTILWGFFVALCCGQGIGSGVHRLWSHRSYKAKLPLRIMLAFFQTIALQNHIYEWVRDHRVHHKFTETDADPHNAARGFFFSHMGWLLVKKHKDVIIKGKSIDLSDLEADPVVMFQKKYYLILGPLCCFIIPTLIPWYFWNENFWVCLNTVGVFRYVTFLHGTWSVNSVAHIWGTKPYDKNIAPTENVYVSYVVFGEGWHNYHHVFPWDYKAAELGDYNQNWSTGFIDFMAKIGWAYDLKTVSVDMIKKRITRTGDGTKKVNIKETQNGHVHQHHDEIVWGWGDTDMNEEDIKDVKIFNKILQ